MNQLKRLVTEKLKISDILHKYNPEGNYQAGQTCFCPFHDNENTPSASIYDNEGVETLYCFSEKKLYSSADAIEKLLKKDVYEVAQSLWERMGDVEKKQWLESQPDGDFSQMFQFEEDEEDEEEDSNNALKQIATLFKKRKITLREFLKEYIKKGGVG